MPSTRASKTTTKKTTRSRPATTSKKTTGRRRTKKSSAVSPAVRHQMIQEVAYLKAEARGFLGGDTEADWLAAEAEVDQQISTRA